MRADNENPSRRTAMTVISAAAAGIAALTTAAAASAEPADAELLELGAGFDALVPEMLATRAAAFAYSDAIEQETARRIGGTNPVPPLQLLPTMLWHSTFCAVEREMGPSSAVDVCEAAATRLDEVLDAIMATPAHTMAGLAVKARAAAILTHDYLWHGPTIDLDWNDEILRSLFEAIFAAAGLPVPREVQL